MTALSGSGRGADQARKPGARAEIKPVPGCGGREGDELSAVQDVPVPKLSAFASRDQIYPGVPMLHEIDEFPEPVLRFT